MRISFGHIIFVGTANSPCFMKTFAEWKLADLESTFGLRQVLTLPALEAWLTAQETLTDKEMMILQEFQSGLKANVFGWNEQELSLQFVGPVLTLAHFGTDRINFFAGREFRGMVAGQEMFGKPDGMIAAGQKSPEKPYFCFQEYKKNIDPDGDPFGQCLAAMLVAQSINPQTFPVYGLVVVGQQWNFMLLDGLQYAISPGYSALDDDLYHIFMMLKKLKKDILKMMP